MMTRLKSSGHQDGQKLRPTPNGAVRSRLAALNACLSGAIRRVTEDEKQTWERSQAVQIASSGGDPSEQR